MVSDHFTSGLPSKRVAADCLIFDEDGRFLVVEPTYKRTWDIPGGVAEIDESPRGAAMREIAEELGVEVEPGALLAVDWVSQDGPTSEVVGFLFDGGVVDVPDGGFTLQADEIASARFVTLAEAGQLMAGGEFCRVEAALAARERRSAVYLENGRPIGGDEGGLEGEPTDDPVRLTRSSRSDLQRLPRRVGPALTTRGTTNAVTAMHAERSSEPGSTLGVEEEYHLLDPATYELVNLAALSSAAAGTLRGEMLTSQLEAASPVCGDLAEVGTAIDTMRSAAAEAAAEHGAVILAASTHPTAPLAGIEVAGRARYDVLLDRFGGVVRQFNLTGCHVHVSVPDLDTAVAVMNHARPYLPVLAALCASSPFHEGIDTGWASYRLAQLALWPQGGLPPYLHDADAYLAVVDELTRAGMIAEPSALLWELRPSARFPTVEFRIADIPTDARDVLLYAGLVRSLVRTLAARAADGERAPQPTDVLLRAARWRAARYGLDDSLWSVAANALVPARLAVEELWDVVEPDLARHGEAGLLRGLLDGVLRRGTSATRQRNVFAATGDLRAMISDALALTAEPVTAAIVPGLDRR